MALFGVSSYVSDGVDPVIYEQGDEKIIQSQYRGALQQAQRRAISQSTSIDVSSDAFKTNVLRQLLSQVLVRALSRDAGYLAADESVAKLILENTAFQVDGKFDQATYDRFVAGNFGSKIRYEQLLKDSVVSAQVASGLTDSDIEIPNRGNDILSFATEKRDFDMVRYSVDDLVSTIELSDEQIAEYYQSSQALYQEPEKISVKYITLNAKTYEAGITLTEEDLLAIYEEEKESFSSTETREVRHILFTGSDAESQASTALVDIRGGALFEDLAKELSQDPGSAVEGGDLGDIPRGQMVEPFEESAFSLALNTVSEPVSTEFGYHLIEVTAINGGKTKPFDEVKESLRVAEISKQAEEIFFTKAEDLRNAVFENKDTLQIAADDLGLTIETSDYFTRNEGKDYFNNPSVRGSAFSDTVLLDNENSEVIDVSPTELLVLRKDNYLEQQAKPLEEVKELVVNSLKRELAIEQTAEKLNSDYDAIINSGDWIKSTADLGLSPEPSTMTYLDQSDSTPFGVSSAIFSSSDVNYKESIGKAVDINGDAYLFKLNSIVEGSAEALDKEIVDLVNSDLAARNSSSLVQSFISKKLEQAMATVDTSLL
jgi:peptidyl-prolyl cis-trans isomerase D